MDRLGADFEASFQSIKEKLTPNAVALNIPIGKEDKFEGVVDLIRMKKVEFHGEHGEQVINTEIPEDLKNKA